MMRVQVVVVGTFKMELYLRWKKIGDIMRNELYNHYYIIITLII